MGRISPTESGGPDGCREERSPRRRRERSPALPNHPITLATGPVNGADTLTIELIRPDSMPAMVRIVWPSAPTITTPARYVEVARTAMRLLAEASNLSR